LHADWCLLVQLDFDYPLPASMQCIDSLCLASPKTNPPRLVWTAA